MGFNSSKEECNFFILNQLQAKGRLGNEVIYYL